MERAELLRDLLRPEAYGHPVEEVEWLETHVSWLFFAGPRVYKVKKPVDLGFLDFSALELRRHFCEEEVRLNRRLAADTYLGVVAITRGPDGRLRVGGEAEALEFAVEMRRLPSHRMLSRFLADGVVDNGMLAGLARRLAEFHAAADTGAGVDEHGRPAAVRFNVEENFEQIEPFVGPVAPGSRATLSEPLLRRLEAAAAEFLARQTALFDRRVREGRIRDGHGDLHSENICLLPEEIAVFDCIEFAPRFRCGDVACDLAFLAMDLDHRGYRAFSRYLVRRYADESGDAGVLELMDFYKAYRAVVRGKVLSIQAAGAGDSEPGPEALRRRARRYFCLAASYQLAPSLVLCCGLPASGKSFAAHELARLLGGVVLRSDVFRKVVAGIPPAEHRPAAFGEALYAPERTDETYERMLELARAHLRDGETVFVDASFPTPERRAPFVELAERADAPFALLEFDCDPAIVRERMRERAERPDSASDADFAIYLEARKCFRPPDEIAPESRLRLGGVEAPELTAGWLLDRLR